MVELALAMKDRGVCSLLALTPVPGIHACQAERSFEHLAKGFAASSIADTCRQLHTPVGRANQAEACTRLSSRNSPFATGSPIKQNGGAICDDIEASCIQLLHQCYSVPFCTSPQHGIGRPQKE